MRHVDLRETGQIQKINCPVLLTPRLVLRLPHTEDIDALLRLANNRHITAQFDKMPYPFLRTDAEDFVKRAENGQIGYYVYAITQAESGEFIGCCGIGAYKGGIWHKKTAQASAVPILKSSIPEPDKGQKNRTEIVRGAELPAQNESGDGCDAKKNLAAMEVFLWLGEPYWRQGYGTEVATALVDAAFRATELPALYARAREGNEAARKILHKCGFSLLHKSGYHEEGSDIMQSFGHYDLSRDAWLCLRRAMPRQAG